eukprot:11734679-Alexandrium_andersonii.AAC.1
MPPCWQSRKDGLSRSTTRRGQAGLGNVAFARAETFPRNSSASRWPARGAAVGPSRRRAPG